MSRFLLSLAVVLLLAGTALAQPVGNDPRFKPNQNSGSASLTLPGFSQTKHFIPDADKSLAAEALIKAHDKNGDRKLNADECPVLFRSNFASLDLNHDRYLTVNELGLGLGGEGSPANRGMVKRGKVIANFVYTVADDFVVEVYQNGAKVADGNREMIAETFGATDEKITIEVREGDWLVFNVVNNRLRWGGSSYFAVAGMKMGNGVGFVSDVTSTRWTYCDDPSQVNAFIADPTSLAGQTTHPSVGKWDRGDARMNELTDGWKGTSVWGKSRNTWIKYVAPAP